MAVVSLRALEFHVGVAWGSVPGEQICGDTAVIAATANGALLAVIDGVGHGEAAAEAAERAAEVLRADPDQVLEELVRRCHRALRDSRGVTMALASVNLDQHLVSWLGIGNTQGILTGRPRSGVDPSEVLMQRSGLIGHTLPVLQAETLVIEAGDALALATDGVWPITGDALGEPDDAQRLAERVLARLRRPQDDALVLTARFRAGDSP